MRIFLGLLVLLAFTSYVEPYTIFDQLFNQFIFFFESFPPIWQILDELAHHMSYTKTDLASKLINAFFNNLNITYNAILQSKDSNGVYIYDLLPMALKTPFLYQLKAHDFCYTTNIPCENTLWINLPVDIRKLLEQEKFNLNFLTIKLYEWGLVDRENPLANLTMMSFIKSECEHYIKDFSKFTNPIELGMQVDLKKIYKIAFSDFCFMHINYLPKSFNDFLTTMTHMGEEVAYTELTFLNCLKLPNYKLTIY